MSICDYAKSLLMLCCCMGCSSQNLSGNYESRQVVFPSVFRFVLRDSNDSSVHRNRRVSANSMTLVPFRGRVVERLDSGDYVGVQNTFFRPLDAVLYGDMLIFDGREPMREYVLSNVSADFSTSVPIPIASDGAVGSSILSVYAAGYEKTEVTVALDQPYTIIVLDRLRRERSVRP